jgi:hypothetical protein
LWSGLEEWCCEKKVFMRRINDAEEWEAEQIPNENPTLLPLSSSEKQRHRPFIQKLLGRAGAMVAELVIGSGAWWGTCTKPHSPIHQATPQLRRELKHHRNAVDKVTI